MWRCGCSSKTNQLQERPIDFDLAAPPAPSPKMVAQNFEVDLNKPLVFQVGHLGEAYEEWVHQPIISKEGPRFFKSDYMEFLTRTVWWAVPAIWLPVVCYSISVSARKGLTPSHVALLVVLGLFFWTFSEYTLHRFLSTSKHQAIGEIPCIILFMVVTISTPWMA